MLVLSSVGTSLIVGFYFVSLHDAAVEKYPNLNRVLLVVTLAQFIIITKNGAYG